GHHEPDHLPAGCVPDVAGGHHEFAAVRHQESPLRLADADPQSPVGVGALPPVAAFRVVEREYIAEVFAEGVVCWHPGETGCHAVEGDHPALVVCDHQPVGKVLGRQQSRTPTMVTDCRLAATHDRLPSPLHTFLPLALAAQSWLCTASVRRSPGHRSRKGRYPLVAAATRAARLLTYRRHGGGGVAGPRGSETRSVAVPLGNRA